MRPCILHCMPVKENLRYLMRQAGLNPHSLAKETGVKQPTIFRILEGESETPRDSTLRPIADFFGLRVEVLRYGDLEQDRPVEGQGKPTPIDSSEPKSVSVVMASRLEPLEGMQVIREEDLSHYNTEPAAGPSGKRTAPVISWVQAGEWAEAHDPYPPGDGEGFEEVPDTAGANVFWLRVVGDSMTAPVGMSIPEGHLILVDPDQEAENGSLVVAKLTDSDEVTFKKLVIDAGQKYLKPLNPAYETVKINGNCRIVGVVREAKVKFF